MSGAFYNEIDPAACAVLRELIINGVIAPGVVDSRPIQEVRPDDVRGFSQVHLFAGGGLWSVAARLAGWPDDRPLWTGSCPCQPFSQAGKQRGFDDERDLWPEFGRLIRAIRPPVVVGEQVVIPCRAISLEDVQVMRGAQAIHGILCKLEGPNAGRLHRMLQGEGAAEEVWFDGASIGFAQEMESEQSCGGSYHISKIPGETEGPGVRSGRGERASTDEDRQGRMRGDGDSLRPGRWQNLEFAFARQDRSDDRISFDECSRGDLRPECDAEHMGRDNADGRRRQTKGAKRRGRKQPSWSVGGETSPEAGRHWVDRIATDLGQDGYAFRTCNIPAASVDAPHIRQRLYWVAMADADCCGRRGRAQDAQRGALSRVAAEWTDGASVGVTLGNAFGARLEGQHGHGDGAPGWPLAHRSASAPDGRRNNSFWAGAGWLACHDGKARRAEPSIRLLVDGLPGRVDLWRIGGNAIVPQVAAEVLAALMETGDERSAA